ncbi:MAG: C-GCAxxG-C-C family (seleno)protein, partial [Thermodesulfovibrionales bacterium]
MMNDVMVVGDLIRNGFGDDLKLNCAEKILHGANEVYDLGLDREALKLARGMGGGMGIESVCGAL